MKDPRDIIWSPVVSEKSYRLIEDNVYTFKVDPRSTKPEIKDAIREIFEVEVLSVNTLNRKGKRVRNRRDGSWGKKPDQKRALVKIAEGQTIDLFEG